jgi:hypothetical protein
MLLPRVFDDEDGGGESSGCSDVDCARLLLSRGTPSFAVR